MSTKIEWADEVWNPVTGCTHAGSPACDHCYARRMAQRLAGRFGYPSDDPFRVTTHEDRLGEPNLWRKPRRVFVCSMADLFHDDVPRFFISQILFQIMVNKEHTFLLLTKRPERMAKVLASFSHEGGLWEIPLLNVWTGITAENQEWFDNRWYQTYDMPSVLRFISAEPLLGPIDMQLEYEYRRPHWVIIGPETGPKARPSKPEWFLSIIEQCQSAGVPVFMKKEVPGVPLIREFPRSKPWTKERR